MLVAMRLGGLQWRSIERNWILSDCSEHCRVVIHSIVCSRECFAVGLLSNQAQVPGVPAAILVVREAKADTLKSEQYKNTNNSQTCTT